MKKLFIAVFVFLFTAQCAPGCFAVSASSAIAVECSDFDVYYELASNERREIASVTKVMTAVVALEVCTDLSKEVTIPDEAVGVEGSSIYLKHGEILTVYDLLRAVLLNSANDAATALAISVAGSVEEFAVLMNQKARSLCMTGTSYVNPHGLPAHGHYSTARDQALLACYAVSIPAFREISSAYTCYIPYDGVENGRQLVNHNKLLRSYYGCIGVKTGYTKSAGRCLVSAAQRDGVTLVCVTLGAPDDWNDHKSLLDTGFSLFERVLLSCAKEQGAGIPVAGEDSVLLCTNENEISAVLRKERGDIVKRVVLPRFVYPQASTGKVAGSVSYYCDGELIGKDNIFFTGE